MLKALLQFLVLRFGEKITGVTYNKETGELVTVIIRRGFGQQFINVNTTDTKKGQPQTATATAEPVTTPTTN
jgi:hypothetical protein